MTIANRFLQETQNLIKQSHEELDQLVDNWACIREEDEYTVKITNGTVSEIFSDSSELGCLKKALKVARELNEDAPYEIVDHPNHYGGASAKHEAISVIEEWNLGFHLGNVVKYISRAGKKPDQNTIDDLKKAKWYLERYIQNLETK